MKFFIVVLLSLVTLPSLSLAEDSASTIYTLDLVARSFEEAASVTSNQKVAVIFQVPKDADVEKVLPIVKSAMQVRDPDAWIYPYWVTEIIAEKKFGRCGLVIGRWWSQGQGEGSNKWEPRVYNRISSSVNMASFGYFYNYAYGQEPMMLTNEYAVSVQPDEVMKKCFEFS